MQRAPRVLISFSTLISFSVQLLTYSVRNVLVAIKLVSVLRVINELSQMDCQKLVVLPTVRISLTPALGVLAGAARTAQHTIYSSPMCCLPASVFFGTELHRLLMAYVESLTAVPCLLPPAGVPLVVESGK